MRRGCPHCELTLTEEQAIFIPYLYSERSRFSPLWQCRAEHLLYAKLRQEFESLWAANDFG